MSEQSIHHLHTQTRLALVIPYYRGARDIEACLRSVTTGTRVPDKVILVDNDMDGVHATLSPGTLRDIEVLRSRPAIGFGRASNMGVLHAFELGCEICMVLNQDTILDPECVAQMLETYTRTGSIAVVSAVCREYSTNAISGHFRTHILETIPGYIADEHQQALRRSYPLPVVFATCILFDRTFFDRFGLFDPLFTMYGEDLDFSQRVIRSGGALYLSTFAFVHHRHGQETGDPVQQRSIQSHRAFSKLILRARYTSVSMVRLHAWCSYLFFRHLFSQTPIRAGTYSRFIVFSILHWNALKSQSVADLHRRTREATKRDLQ